MQCFYYGAEIGQHKKTHGYIITDYGSTPLYAHEKDWTARNEQTLLDGVEQYGFGNWNDVASLLPGKSIDDIQDHYLRYYVDGSIGRVCASVLLKSDYRVPPVVDHTGPASGPLSPSLSMPLLPVDVSRFDALELGYMPLRDDFEREHDNEAEQLVSSLTSHAADEDELDAAYKRMQVETYRLRLRERARRKRVARDFNVIGQYVASNRKGQPGAKKKTIRERKEFEDKMKRFAQFMTPTEHERFFNNLQEEKQLKARIKQLIRYRKHGLVKLVDCAQFERDCIRRERNKDALRKKIFMPPPQKKVVLESGAIMPTETDNEMGSYDKFAHPCPKVLRPSTVNLANELLSSNEKKLCRNIGMSHTNYVTLKASIIKDYVKRNKSLPAKLRFPSDVDRRHRRTILKFLCDSGWISASNCIDT